MIFFFLLRCLSAYSDEGFVKRGNASATAASERGSGRATVLNHIC